MLKKAGVIKFTSCVALKSGRPKWYIYRGMDNLSAIFEHKYQKLVALAAGVLGHNSDEAADIVHDAYIELAESDKPATEAMICSRVISRAKNELRRRNGHASPLSDLPEGYERRLQRVFYGEAD